MHVLSVPTLYSSQGTDKREEQTNSVLDYWYMTSQLGWGTFLEIHLQWQPGWSWVLLDKNPKLADLIFPEAPPPETLRMWQSAKGQKEDAL